MEGGMVALIAAGVMIVVFFAVTVLFARSMHKRMDAVQQDLDLHAPLLPNENEAGFTKCELCGFENFKRFQFCNVCGTGLQVYPGDVSNGSKCETGALCNASLTLRQKRARKRKEWIRKIDVEGNVFWYRGTTTTRTGSGNGSNLPGYVVRFLTKEDAGSRRTMVAAQPQAAPTEPKVPEGIVDVVGESIQEVRASRPDQPEAEPDFMALPTEKERTQELEQLVATSALQVVESTQVNAAELPLMDSSSEDSRVDWQALLLLASNVFPDKYAHFVTVTAGLIAPAEEEVIKLRVNRSHLFEESMESLSIIPAVSIRSSMRLVFLDESGIDAGGLSREWFVLLNEQLVDPMRGVFKCVNKSNQTFFLNSNSAHDIGDTHLSYYYATGRLIGRALLEGSVLGFHLSPVLVKMILGVPISFSDLEYFDPDLFKNLSWLRDNENVDELGLDFSVTEQRGDTMEVVELIPCGQAIDATADNKDEYIERRFRYVLFESVADQLHVFLKGLYEVIPRELLMLFDPEEFDYLLCGSDEIDVDDWEQNTKYTENLYTHPVLKWFWELLREMPNEYRRRLLHFATGSSRVPLSGFAGLTSYDGKLCPFTLKGVPLVNDGYIWSHACFNLLDLPLHVVRSEFRAVLYAAVETELYGFTTN
ncbi:Nedd4 e3 ubiquitin-protein ligase wwp1, partial [Globisporangium splendens]